MEWISVKDRLPEEVGLYSVLFDDDTTINTWYLTTLAGERMFMILDSPLFRNIITHWREIAKPEPMKKEQPIKYALNKKRRNKMYRSLMLKFQRDGETNFLCGSLDYNREFREMFEDRSLRPCAGWLHNQLKRAGITDIYSNSDRIDEYRIIILQMLIEITN